MVSLTLHRYFGAKAWVAEITGVDPRYGLARSFLRASERSSSRSGATGDATYDIERPGLYQVGGGKQVVRDHGEYRVVWLKDGALAWKNIDAKRAKEIAKLMSGGMDFEAARQATKQPVVAK